MGVKTPGPTSPFLLSTKRKHMLNSISWQQYLAALLLSTAAWYVYVGLRYYRPELSALLRIKPKSNSGLPEVASSHAVMGAARPEPGTNVSEAEELIFSPGTDDRISDQTLAKGPADDLLAEAKILISAFADNDDKPGFLSVLRTLISQYEVFADEISLPQVTGALQAAANKLPFTITADEWPQTFEV
jgi:hypothetical protein